jgi:hypothetical protein
MSGTVSKAVNKVLGKDGSPGTIKEVVEPIAKAQAQKSASAEAAEDAAARRRARRGGRALLSEARLTPEQGVGQQTLGAGPMA